MRSSLFSRERDFIPTHRSLRRGALRGGGTSVFPRHQRVERLVGLGGQVRDLAQQVREPGGALGVHRGKETAGATGELA